MASVVIRTFTSGSPVDSVINQPNWNIDKLDGTGASGKTIDFSKAQIFIIDYQWLGVGRVRWGFFIDGVVVYCHQNNAANAATLVYMQMPNLPLRYELVSTVAAAASVLQICAQVESEGGVEDNGFTLSVDTGVTPLVTLANTNIYVLLAVRLQSTKQQASIVPTFFSTMTTTNNAAFRTTFLLNPTIAGALAFTPVANSAVEFVAGATANTITAGTGTQLFSSYAGASGTVSTSIQDLPDNLQPGASIAGVSDILVLAIQPATGAATTVFGSLSWREQD